MKPSIERSPSAAANIYAVHIILGSLATEDTALATQRSALIFFGRFAVAHGLLELVCILQQLPNATENGNLLNWPSISASTGLAQAHVGLNLSCFHRSQQIPIRPCPRVLIGLSPY